MARPIPLEPPVMSAARSTAPEPYLNDGLRSAVGAGDVSYPSLPVSRRASIVVALLACALLGGCGGDDDDAADRRPPVANPAEFPAANGRSLADLRKGLGRGGPVLAPSVLDLTTGENRFGFGLFERDRSQIADAQVVVYVAPIGGGPANGPYQARYESLEVKPQFQSQQ